MEAVETELVAKLVGAAGGPLPWRDRPQTKVPSQVITPSTSEGLVERLVVVKPDPLLPALIVTVVDAPVAVRMSWHLIFCRPPRDATPPPPVPAPSQLMVIPVIAEPVGQYASVQLGGTWRDEYGSTAASTPIPIS